MIGYLIPFQPDWHALQAEIAAGPPEHLSAADDEACGRLLAGGHEEWLQHKARKPYSAAQFARHVRTLPPPVRQRRRP